MSLPDFPSLADRFCRLDSAENKCGFTLLLYFFPCLVSFGLPQVGF